MSAGQISNQLWGKYDDRFDALGELVIDKNSMGVPPNIINVNSIKECHLVKMKWVYDKNINICKKWSYCLKSEFRTMVRECVYFGSLYAYQWVKEALK
jgi:hypothetical protein